ncbi:MAG: hypothetical protein ACLVAW_23355 [Eisenbergiella massiliensis]
MDINLNVTVTISGDIPENKLHELEESFRRIVQNEFPPLIKKEMDKETKRKAIQEGFA